MSLCVRCRVELRIHNDLVAPTEELEQAFAHYADSYVTLPPSPPPPALVDRVLLLAASQHGHSAAPLCEPCMQIVLEDLRRSLAQSTRDLARLTGALAELEKRRPTAPAGSDALMADPQQLQTIAQSLQKELDALEAEERSLHAELAAALDHERTVLRPAEAAHARDLSDFQRNLLDQEDASEAVERKLAYCNAQIRKLKRTSVLQETFQIVYGEEGETASINGLRLGRPEVPWAEVNAALGLVCLLLDVLVKRCHVPLAHYRLLPRGSFSVVIRKADRTALELFDEEGGLTRFFTGRRFDGALVALVHVVGELLSFLQRTDRSVRLPFKVEGDRVGGLAVTLQFSAEETWTRAMRLLLINLKWLVAFVESQPQ